MEGMMCNLQHKKFVFTVDTSAEILRRYGEFKHVEYEIYGDTLYVYPVENRTGKSFRCGYSGSGHNRLQMPVGMVLHFIDFLPGRNYEPRFGQDFFSVCTERWTL